MAHGDYTGQKKALLAQQYRDEQQLAAQRSTLVTQVVTEGRSEVINLFNDYDEWAQDHTFVPGEGGEGVEEVDAKHPDTQPVKFRASETLDQITVGKDREFNLEQGRDYIAPLWVVRHLDEKGLVWH